MFGALLLMSSIKQNRSVTDILEQEQNSKLKLNIEASRKRRKKIWTWARNQQNSNPGIRTDGQRRRCVKWKFDIFSSDYTLNVTDTKTQNYKTDVFSLNELELFHFTFFTTHTHICASNLFFFKEGHVILNARVT